MWFEFRQNNSGGGFGQPAYKVFIEAEDADKANSKAEELGLYFDGVANGEDCECCGDRWYRTSDYAGNRRPPGEPDEWARMWADMDKIPAHAIYYADGRAEVIE